MVTIPRPERLNLPLATVAAATAGGVVALLFLVMPARLLEGAVSASGIPAILAAAEPPLGFTARIALGLVFGGLAAGFAWFGAPLLAGQRLVSLDALLRRATPVPDAPPRPPLFANRDLGTPFLDVKAPVADAAPARHLSAEDYDAAPSERPLPADLNQPLAAFDPTALLDIPLVPQPPIVPLSRPQLIDPGDRFETFELTPVTRPDPAPRSAPLSLRVPPAHSLRATPLREPLPAPLPVVAPETETTIQAMLARLERGVGARIAPAAPPHSALQETLGDLRRLATGG